MGYGSAHEPLIGGVLHGGYNRNDYLHRRIALHGLRRPASWCHLPRFLLQAQTSSGFPHGT